MNRQEAIVAWVGIDWADESHQVCEYEVGTGNKQIYAVEQNAESLLDLPWELGPALTEDERASTDYLVRPTSRAATGRHDEHVRSGRFFLSATGRFWQRTGSRWHIQTRRIREPRMRCSITRKRIWRVGRGLRGSREHREQFVSVVETAIEH